MQHMLRLGEQVSQSRFETLGFGQPVLSIVGLRWIQLNRAPCDAFYPSC